MVGDHRKERKRVRRSEDRCYQSYQDIRNGLLHLLCKHVSITIFSAVFAKSLLWHKEPSFDRQSIHSEIINFTEASNRSRRRCGPSTLAAVPVIETAFLRRLATQVTHSEEWPDRFLAGPKPLRTFLNPITSFPHIGQENPSNWVSKL